MCSSLMDAPVRCAHTKDSMWKEEQYAIHVYKDIKRLMLAAYHVLSYRITQTHTLIIIIYTGIYNIQRVSWNRKNAHTSTVIQESTYVHPFCLTVVAGCTLCCFKICLLFRTASATISFVFLSNVFAAKSWSHFSASIARVPAIG